MTEQANEPHIPVMLSEVIECLSPKDGGIYVDGTFGAGGYTRAILDAANCHVIAIDRDRTALDAAQSWASEYEGRLDLVHGEFGSVQEHVRALGYDLVDGFVLDIGVSSMQIDQPERGFSFRFDGPLDMRMDADIGQTAADIVNEMDEGDLADIIYKYGEERMSRRIARAIVTARKEANIETTSRLADIIRSVVPKKHDKIDPATRTFQALRIYVNDELGELERALEGSQEVLDENGRLVVVTFHSLEDRIVKKFLRDKSGQQKSVSRHLPDLPSKKNATFRLENKKALESTKEENLKNPRARSAKLRYAIKTHRSENAKMEVSGQ